MLFFFFPISKVTKVMPRHLGERIRKKQTDPAHFVWSLSKDGILFFRFKFPGLYFFVRSFSFIRSSSRWCALSSSVYYSYLLSLELLQFWVSVTAYLWLWIPWSIIFQPTKKVCLFLLQSWIQFVQQVWWSDFWQLSNSEQLYLLEFGVQWLIIHIKELILTLKRFANLIFDNLLILNRLTLQSHQISHLVQLLPCLLLSLSSHQLWVLFLLICLLIVFEVMQYWRSNLRQTQTRVIVLLGHGDMCSSQTQKNVPACSSPGMLVLSNSSN